MNWQEEFKHKIVSAAEAVSHVQSGDKIIYGDWLGERGDHPRHEPRAQC